ncbi:unnamed protein product [Trichogramma brassicae]|uniref:Uncharacterized protein n=1 Tax=Trichogramma brassicae TaxID=86971 RepID=A0A6H5I2W3_9HYME|nr:unnamed protein product [Trichogramma brassicae]
MIRGFRVFYISKKVRHPTQQYHHTPSEDSPYPRTSRDKSLNYAVSCSSLKRQAQRFKSTRWVANANCHRFVKLDRGTTTPAGHLSLAKNSDINTNRDGKPVNLIVRRAPGRAVTCTIYAWFLTERHRADPQGAEKKIFTHRQEARLCALIIIASCLCARYKPHCWPDQFYCKLNDMNGVVMRCGHSPATCVPRRASQQLCKWARSNPSTGRTPQED